MGGVLGVMVFNTPNSKGKARDRHVMRGCNVGRVSAKSILHTRVGGNARLNGATGDCVSRKRLVPSTLVMSVLTDIFSDFRSDGKIVFSNFPEAVPRTRTLGMVLGRHKRSVSMVLSLSIPRSRLVAHLVGHKGSSKHTSSGRRAVGGHLMMCGARASPLGRFCGNRKGCRRVGKLNSVSNVFRRVYGTMSALWVVEMIG